MTRIIIQAIPPWASTSRRQSQQYLSRHLPAAEWCIDKRFSEPIPGVRKATLAMIDSLVMAGTDAHVHMEDDVILTVDFRQKLEAAIAERPASVIQFFSMRGADKTVGSRWDGDFLMLQCTYFPAGYAEKIIEFYRPWIEKIEKAGDEGHNDVLIKDFLQSRKERYWIHVPSLVQHRIAKSAIDKRRSSKRQSQTFKDPAE